MQPTSPPIVGQISIVYEKYTMKSVPWSVDLPKGPGLFFQHRVSPFGHKGDFHWLGDVILDLNGHEDTRPASITAWGPRSDQCLNGFMVENFLPT